MLVSYGGFDWNGEREWGVMEGRGFQVVSYVAFLGVEGGCAPVS